MICNGLGGKGEDANDDFSTRKAFAIDKGSLPNKL